MSHPIYILHLTGQWLRWVTIQPGTAPHVTDSGTIDEAPERALERWIARVHDPRAHIVLYDGRPIYYSFSLTLPAEAMKQQDKILRLKLAQELGLAEETIFWAARTEPAPAAPGQTSVFMVVARRETMQDIVTWRARHKLRNLWVGADLCAVRALQAQAEEPLVVVNADAAGATIFYANGTRILKERAEAQSAARPDLGWGEAKGRMHFGGPAPEMLFTRFPTLRELPEVAAGSLKPQASGAVRLSALPARMQEFDAVLLGGILDHAAGHPPLEDLVRVITPPPLEVLMAKATLKHLVAAAALCAAGAGASGWQFHKARGAARAQLAAQVQTIEPSMKQLQTLKTLLTTIKSYRKPAMPVFEAISQAVPQGVLLRAMSLGESGTIQMVGTAQSPEAPNEFARGLAASPLLDKVALKEVKREPKNMVSFQIMAHAKGRGR